MDVATAAGHALRAQGVEHVFGVVGSGNFHVTNALVAAGARFVPAAHEGGAASMADGYARVSGQLAVLSVHQGPGVTNALTGLTEAAKSRTPMVVLAPEATNPRSNFFVDLPGLAAAIGAEFRRLSVDRVTEDVTAACHLATSGAGRTVILALPLDVQAMTVIRASLKSLEQHEGRPDHEGREHGRLVDALDAARRPVFIAGRGARKARDEIAALADRCGALLAVSAAAKGLFAGHPWYLDVSGGFATPLCAELVAGADLVVAWGSTLNMWTTRHGRLIPPSAVVAQVDLEPAALGVHRPVDIGVPGDAAVIARACGAELDRRGPARAGWRGPELRERIAAEGRWRDVSYVDEGGDGRIDPRTLTIALDDLLPAERTVVVDSGNFMGYPSMFLSVPDAAGFCFTQAFQSIGLGLASALGAAVARPDRLTVAALGDGGFLMSVAELTTAVRLGVPLLVVVYDDAAYGAEVHHFGPHGHPLDTVTFPDADLAAVARGFGCAAVTVRDPGDLPAVREWLAGPRERPLVVDAKVASRRGSWWLEEAFRGH
ncbi:thiamine pyrophosphate-binding protein [Phytohabitans aurantiacus]|uniref:Acetolactate synthase I/II/III large subunit n=1 Tax=Phytohabitans aurantiacus TaxID=3016789 RepID=A0ABQ5QX14_9ACTN|nr:thiamine pyrophosphate-binding protein [Phytohabitans aurantiacus]GLH99098.1 acetolactate synthase I/II/III large subunit [Phytohabitans aurantiacus]